MNRLLKSALAAAVILPVVITLALLWPTATPGPIPLPEDHTGPDHPPTLTEFGDFQCPYCASFAAYAVPALHEDFVDQGLLHYEYRHFPILGPTSVAAAEASECARDQNAFTQYHDALFAIIHTTADPPTLTPNNLLEIANLLDLDLSAFTPCLMDRHHQPTVQAQAQQARSLGARGTPALFIDGQPLPWKDYPDLTAQLQAYLEAHSHLHE